jgi:hypothetical protein
MTASPSVRIGLFVAAAILAVLPVSASAEDSGDSHDNQGTVQVGPVSSGPVVSKGSAGYDPNGITASASTVPGASGTTTSAPPVYVYHPVPGNAAPGSCPTTESNGVVSNPCAQIPTSVCPAAETGYYVYDSNGNALGLVCVPNPTDSLAPPSTPELALADEASSRQPWPVLRLSINPSIGLTGLPSWFWLSGNSSMQDAVASSGPLTVRVRARLEGVSWEFGDGLGYDSIDLGQAYPAQSEIQHLYQTDTYRVPNGYPVVAILRYLVTYSVNGGSWQTLGVKTRPISQQYLVYQVQPEAVAGQ